MATWPLQLKRLLNLVENGVAAQGVAVSTYFGYSEKKTSDLLSKFYPVPWSHSDPMRFIEDAPLQLVVAAASGPNRGLAP